MPEVLFGTKGGNRSSDHKSMAQEADLPQHMTVGIGTSLATGMMFGVSRNISAEDLKGMVDGSNGHAVYVTLKIAAESCRSD